jgi:hypothetical protein
MVLANTIIEFVRSSNRLNLDGCLTCQFAINAKNINAQSNSQPLAAIHSFVYIEQVQRPGLL